MPTVSVLMVFHRDTPHLRPAVASVLAQTWTDFELVLVDNGTGLDAAALGEPGRDARLRWVRLARNEGIPAGHNAGVAAARGEWVALQDYDDISLPTRLERQVAALRADTGLGAVSALARRIDAGGRRLPGVEFTVRTAADHRRYSRYAAPMVTPALLVRRQILETLPYRPELRFSADLDFQMRLVERWPTAVWPEVLLHYRWYAEQTTQTRLAEIERTRCALQLATARRRAGRAEGLADLLAGVAGLSVAAAWRRGAVTALAEEAWELAAFQARRAWAAERTPGGACRALALGWRVWRAAPPSERRAVARMFLTGPVRALGLRPL